MRNDNVTHFPASSNLIIFTIDIIRNTCNRNSVDVGLGIKINATHCLENSKPTKRSEKTDTQPTNIPKSLHFPTTSFSSSAHRLTARMNVLLD